MAEEEEEVVITEKALKEEENKGDGFQERVESSIEAAMKARVGHIKEQSSSLTLEGVRRLLEKDLGLEQYALDKHKRFVKQLLADLTEDSNDVNDSKNSEDAGEKGNDVETGEKGVVKEEQEESLENHQGGKDTNESLSQDTSKLDDSPVFGLLKENKAAKSKRKKSEEVVEKKAPTNKTIAAAIRKRAKYLKVNSEQLTLAGLRRLLEEDLELEKHSLDPFKNFIRDQVDEVLLDPKKASQSSPSVKKKVVTKNVKQKVAKKVKSEESSDSAESDSDEDEDDVKPKRKNVRKEKASNTPKKRKKPTEDKKTGGKKIKTAEKSTDDNSDEENGNFSEDNHSHSSAEKSTKSKVVSTPTYGKRVETLKSVIKSCGMSVPPALYKKIKQVPESKRESQLIKELQDMLSKEGLSSNPSEKEIKEVRKRKERAKELEGIDMSNIVSSTRRRSTASYAVTVKPKIPVESGSESSEDEEEEDDDGDDDDDDDNGNDGSQSEESNVEDEENSD